MTAAGIGSALPLRLVGSPFDRGANQAGHASAGDVQAMIAARLDTVRNAGALGPAAQDYLGRQFRFCRDACPAAMAEVAGIATGFDIPEDDVFTYLHCGILTDIAEAGGQTDGCSAWAVSQGPDGPLVVKNRDIAAPPNALQRVFRHDGPDLDHGPVLCLGTLGAPGAYSSGINAEGLTVADTQVGVRTHAAGWLRYFLMTEILAKTADVPAAIALIRSRKHAGGGTLLLGDRWGAAAAVELGADRVAVEEGALVYRTNHFVSASLGSENRRTAGGPIDENSQTRFDRLKERLPKQTWDVETAADLMAEHGQMGSLCQHGEARTIASVVYCCRQSRLHACLDNPCASQWHEVPLRHDD